ncbi:hypothetical protein [Streptomyces ziwulingensis]
MPNGDEADRWKWERDKVRRDTPQYKRDTAEYKKEKMDGQRRRRANPTFKKHERERQRERREEQREQRREQRRQQRRAAEAERGPLFPKIVALEVYGSYQERSAGTWPVLPPAGLCVALDGRSAGVEGREAVVVRLDVPGSQGLSGTPVPTLLADPSLDLADVGVRSRIFAAGVDEGGYRAAESAQGVLLDVLRVEEFGADAAFPLGQGQNEEQYGYGYGYADDYGYGPAESFGGVDVNELMSSGPHLGAGEGMAEGWAGATNPVGSYAASYLPTGTYGGVPAQGADSLSTVMEALAVSARAFPAAGSYAPAGQDSNVAYSQWDTSAFLRSGVQPAARDRSPSPGPSAGPSSGGRQYSSQSSRTGHSKRGR